MNERANVRETQVRPVAGIWYCPNCGRRIQVITDSNVEEIQPFTCVCGNMMRPGEEHSVVESKSPDLDEKPHG